MLTIITFTFVFACWSLSRWGAKFCLHRLRHSDLANAVKFSSVICAGKGTGSACLFTLRDVRWHVENQAVLPGFYPNPYFSNATFWASLFLQAELPRGDARLRSRLFSACRPARLFAGMSNAQLKRISRDGRRSVWENDIESYGERRGGNGE